MSTSFHRAGVLLLAVMFIISRPLHAFTEGGGDGMALLKGLALLDEHGRTLTAERLNGRIVVLNFIFTHCGTSCPMQTEQLAAVERSLSPAVRAQVYFISVSVDPANDAPAVLKQYADARGLDLEHWALVTGTPDQIDKLTRSFDAFAADGSNPRTGRHTTDVRLFDTHGRFMQRYAGVPVDRPRLLQEIGILAALSGHS